MHKALPAVLLTVLVITGFGGCVVHSSPAPGFFTIRHDSIAPRQALAVIIPGLNKTGAEPEYDAIGTLYNRNGIAPVIVNVNWNAVGINNITATARQLAGMISDSFPGSKFHLFGFSFGAVIALKVSQLMDVEQVLLCSMSPLFKEDKAFQLFPFGQILGMITDYSKNGLSYSESKETCSIFLYGEHDSFAINKAIILNRKDFFKCNETIMVPEARHDLSTGSYLSVIGEIIPAIGK
jgi:hypothetical protein